MYIECTLTINPNNKDTMRTIVTYVLVKLISLTMFLSDVLTVYITQNSNDPERCSWKRLRFESRLTMEEVRDGIAEENNRR